jgi:hypothetical protein
MADASVPIEDQCLIVLSKTSAGVTWVFARLLYIDDYIVNEIGERFYIPSGTHTLGFNTTLLETEYGHRDGQSVRIDRREEAQVEFTGTFLAGKTYRLIVGNNNTITMEEYNVSWEPPKISLAAPRNEVLTDWAKPRSLYAIPILNPGFFTHYSNIPGEDANIIGWSNDYGVIYSQRGHTGTNLITFGMTAQAGIEVGYNKLGLSLLGEVNLGIGFGGDKYEASAINCSYLLLSELYFDKVIGFGFGYGTLMTVYDFFGSGINELNRAAYDNTYPFYRFQLLLIPKRIIPITVYVDYYFQHNTWGGGIRMNFATKGERAWPSKILQ